MKKCGRLRRDGCVQPGAYSEPRKATRIHCGPCVPPSAEVQMKVRSRTIAFWALAQFCAHTLTAASVSPEQGGGGREGER